MASPEEVAEFLKTFKRKSGESGLIVVPTKKNRWELAVSGLMPHERKEIILGLTPAEYCEGPQPDDDGSAGDVWKFGKKVGAVTVYIKLKLTTEAKCLSFHSAEREMTFPFGNQR